MTEPQRTDVMREGRAGSMSPMFDRPRPDSLADLLERVLDKGVVLAGDIRVNLLDIELLTIKIRLLLVSVDKAAEMGIDWWRRDPMLSSEAVDNQQQQLQQENAELRARLDALESGGNSHQVIEPGDDQEDDQRDSQAESTEEVRQR
jgi:hypothetical protein